MASAVPILSKEETNFLRLTNLLIRLSPKAVRTLFNRQFNPGSLKSIFSKNLTKLDKLKKNHVITQTQWSLLFPSGSDPKSNNFDLTLMVCLLRNLSKVTIRDKLPQPSDLTEGAAVSRIKYYRNQIAHSESGAMSDEDFSTTFVEVSKAIEILCPTMKSDCNSLQHADLDQSFHEIYVEFIKNEKQMEELTAQVKTLNMERQNIESFQTEEIAEWKSKLETFYVTEAATRLIKVVKDNQCTIITGIPGSGKSSLAYYVAICMQDTEDYTVLPVMCPSELIKMSNSNAKQLYIFDDIFGKYSLNDFNLNCWETETNRIKKLLKNQDHKVVVTCRSYLYDLVSDSLSSQSFEHFNLQSDEITLSLVERKNISKLYLTDDVVRHLNDKIVMMYNFFPLLCVMFKEKNMDNADFFQNPNKFIENEIENFKRKKNVSFLALSLLVLSNNSIEKECLQIGKDKYDSLLQDLCDEMDTRKSPSKTSILSSLQNLKNMYLEETESIFCTKHDKIFDIISHTVGNFIIRCILRHGESTFISSRCQLNSLNEKHGDSTIMITDKLETMYFERILKDIERGHTWEVFASIQMKFKKFRILLMQYLEKFNTHFSISGTDGTTALHVTAAKGYFDMSKYILGTNRKMIFSLDSKKKSPLHFASMYGHHEIANLFLSYGAEIDLIDSDGCTPLLTSSLFGNLNVTEVLIKNHANVNICTTKHGWSALHFAAEDENIEHIKLLVQHKAIVNSQLNNGMTPLYISSECGQLNAVKFLIESKADVDKCENEGWSPLKIACLRGFYDIAEILILNYADVNKNTKHGKTPLHCACEGNHIDIVQLLLQHGSVIDQGDGDEETPLHITCSNGYVDIVKSLCEFGVSTNKRNQCGYTSLHYCCYRDTKNGTEEAIVTNASVFEKDEIKQNQLIQAVNTSTDIIKHLVKNGADVNAASNNGTTPIYMACKQNNVEAVKWLLHIEADANKFDDNGWRPLHIACSEGNEDIVNTLLKHGVNIDDCSKKGFTSLHLACSYGNTYIAEILIKNGAVINKVTESGISPLLLAVNNRHYEIAKLLLKNGVEVNSPDEDGRTSLYCAAEKGNMDLIKILIEHEADVNFQRNNGMTPMYVACENNHIEAVKLLLRYKADINKCEETGWSPLHVASHDNHKEVVAYLCDQGAAEVNLSNKEGHSPLYLACQERNEDIATILLKHDASLTQCSEIGFTPFHLACSYGNTNIVKLLIKAGAIVNKVTERGNSPLLLACNDRHYEIAKLLLKNGVEVNSPDEHGRTALYSAAQKGNIDLIKILKEHEADVNIQANNGMTPIYIACSNNHIEAVKILLSYKADINKCEKSGWSPLLVASKASHKEIVAYLCEQSDAVINLSNKYGSTPLHLACFGGNKDVVQLLLKHGAFVNYCNEHALTSFHIACGEGHSNIVELLIKEDAAVNLTDRSNRTPLYIACQNRCADVVELLLKHGAEVNKAAQVEYKEGWTPLHVSASSGNTCITELLLQNNATVKIEDRNGYTPLYYATQKKFDDIIDLLIGHGAMLINDDVPTLSLSKEQNKKSRCKMQ